MKNINKYWPLWLIMAVIVIVVVFIFNKNKANSEDMILFYGDTCPHCKIVNDYIAENNVKERFKFRELEVYNNQANSRLMGKYATQCKLDTQNGLGVPFLFTGTECLMGDQDIINYFTK